MDYAPLIRRIEAAETLEELRAVTLDIALVAIQADGRSRQAIDARPFELTSEHDPLF